MDFDFNAIRLREDRTRGLIVESTCVAALGSTSSDIIEESEAVKANVTSTYKDMPQMSTTYHNIVLGYLLKFRKGIQYLYELLSSYRSNDYLIGVLLHSHEDAFMMFPFNTTSLLDIVLTDTEDGCNYAEYITKLKSILTKENEIMMIKLNIMAAGTNNISVLFLGALIGVEGFYYDKENFCVTNIIQYYSDNATIAPLSMELSGESFLGNALAVKEAPVQQRVTISANTRILVLKGPFVKPPHTVSLAIDTIHKLVEEFGASVVLLTGPLLLRYPSDEIRHATSETLTLPQRYLSAFLHALHTSMVENRCQAILATDCNCLLAPDAYYPTLPYSFTLSNTTNLPAYRTISLAGDPFCIEISGIKIAYMSSMLTGFHFIESPILREQKPNPTTPSQTSHPQSAKTDTLDSRSPEKVPSSSPSSPSQPSLFKKVQTPKSPTSASPTNSLPIFSPPTLQMTEAPPVTKKMIPLNESLMGLYSSLVSGKLKPAANIGETLAGLEQKRLLYYINSSLELQTSIPEFPSSKPLLYTRVRDAWVDPATDIVITTTSLFSPPLAITIYGKQRIVAPFVDNTENQAITITLKKGTDIISNLICCESHAIRITI